MPVLISSEVETIELYDALGPAIVELSRNAPGAIAHLAVRSSTGGVTVMWLFTNATLWREFFTAKVRPILPDGAETAHMITDVHILELLGDDSSAQRV